MGALSDQLLDLQMDDAVPMAHLMVDEGGDGVGGPNAPSPSESEATKAAAAAAAKAAAAASKGGSRSMLKAQKHQVNKRNAHHRRYRWKCTEYSMFPIYIYIFAYVVIRCRSGRR